MLAAVGAFSACSDKDDNLYDSSNDRLARPMFRTNESTGKGDSDPYNCTVSNINTSELRWFKVDGAKGYELKWSTASFVTGGQQAWEETEAGVDGKSLAGHVIIGDSLDASGKVVIKAADRIEYFIKNLAYQTDYRFAIRALNSVPPSQKFNDPDTSWKNDPKNSLWFGYGDGRQWAEYYGQQTGARYFVPQVAQVVYFDKDDANYQKGFRVYLNRSKDNGYTVDQMNEITEHGFKADASGNFNVTYLTLTSQTATIPEQYKKMYIDWANLPTAEIKDASGNVKNVPYIDVVGLASNAMYVINLWDEEMEKSFNQNGYVINANGKEVEGLASLDACYNTISKRTKGTPDAPKLIQHVVTPVDTVGGVEYDIASYGAMKLDHILNGYIQSDAYGENQVFLLEPGKKYFVSSNISISKAFTLKTQENAAGERATLYLSGMTKNGLAVNTCNFMLGRTPNPGENSSIPLDIDSIRFIGLNIELPMYGNYGTQMEGIYNAAGNYFVNMYSNGMGINISLLEWKDCTINGITRGFMRVQGSNDFNIHEMRMTGCNIYNCGYYANGGNGYGYFFGDHGTKTGSNIFEKFVFAENIVYESPNSPLVTDNNRNNMWNEDIRWNIDIHHNTFVNWNTQGSNSQSIINTRYVPGGSTVGFHDNVVIVTAKTGDGRIMKQGGWDLRNVQGGDGSGAFTINVGNNWTTAEGLQWASPGAFSGSSNAPGKSAFTKTCNYPYGIDELNEHVSTLKATDLMVKPNPPYMMDPSAPKATDHQVKGIEGLNYKQTPAVLGSDIYQSGAGCARLRAGNAQSKK